MSVRFPALMNNTAAPAPWIQSEQAHMHTHPNQCTCRFPGYLSAALQGLLSKPCPGLVLGSALPVWSGTALVVRACPLSFCSASSRQLLLLSCYLLNITLGRASQGPKEKTWAWLVSARSREKDVLSTRSSTLLSPQALAMSLQCVCRWPEGIKSAQQRLPLSLCVLVFETRSLTQQLRLASNLWGSSCPGHWPTELTDCTIRQDPS